jgi:hypothetical protein
MIGSWREGTIIEAKLLAGGGLQLDWGVRSMKERLKTSIRRRDLLSFVVVGAGVTTLSALVPEPADAKAVDLKDKRKARYRANSAEVQNFYRVNSYPVR